MAAGPLPEGEALTKPLFTDNEFRVATLTLLLSIQGKLTDGWAGIAYLTAALIGWAILIGMFVTNMFTATDGDEAKAHVDEQVDAETVRQARETLIQPADRGMWPERAGQLSATVRHLLDIIDRRAGLTDDVASR